MSGDLPKWREMPDRTWECGDEDEQFFRFRAWVEFSFDVVDYDQWLATLPAGTTREELLRLRSAAKAEMQAERMEPHLHRIWMSRKDREARHENRIAELEPLASEGQSFAEQRIGRRPSKATQYLRNRWRPGETANDYWERLKDDGHYAKDDPGVHVYFEGDTMYEKLGSGHENEVTFKAFQGRLSLRKSRKKLPSRLSKTG